MNPNDTMDMGPGRSPGQRDDGDGADSEGPADQASEGGFFVDRIEGDKAVLLMGEKTITVPVEMLPKGAKEGSYFGADGKMMADPSGGDAGKMRADLSAGDNGGDINLDEGPTPEEEEAANAGDTDGPNEHPGASGAGLRRMRFLNSGGDPGELGPDDRMPMQSPIKVRGVPTTSRVPMR